MGKRSRDVSFSPSAEEILPCTSDSRRLSDEEAGAPSGKVTLVDTSPLPADAGMQCSLPPHRDALAFTTIEDFEVHYAKEHTNRCSSCGKNFPTAHFLALHIDENHNALREALQAKGEKTYACFVEDCDRKCSSPQKRRLHLIDKHMFPKVYNFRIVDSGIDKTMSMLRDSQRRRISTTDNPKDSFGHRRRTSTSKSLIESSDHPRPKPHVRQPPPIQASTTSDDPTRSDEIYLGRRNDSAVPKTVQIPDVEDLERSMSALRFVPSSVLRLQGKSNAVDQKPGK